MNGYDEDGRFARRPVRPAEEQPGRTPSSAPAWPEPRPREGTGLRWRRPHAYGAPSGSTVG